MEEDPDTAARYKGYIGFSYLSEGKHQEAYSSFTKSIQLALENEQIRQEVFSRMNLGKYLVLQKQYDAATQEFSKAEQLSWKTYDENFNPIPVISNYWIGFTLTEKGDFKGAMKRADQLEELVENGNYDRLHLDFYHLLLGEIEISQQNSQAALDSLDKLIYWTHLVSPVALKIKASSLALIEDNEKAIEEYKNFYTNVWRFKYGMSDAFIFFYERSMADYNIAKIYEKMGDTAKAIEHYEKFLDLMKAADPGIAEVEDANSRLANLKQ
jgi:tetratricopeptide (TPR) repeat protein